MVFGVEVNDVFKLIFCMPDPISAGIGEVENLPADAIHFIFVNGFALIVGTFLEGLNLLQNLTVDGLPDPFENGGDWLR